MSVISGIRNKRVKTPRRSLFAAMLVAFTAMPVLAIAQQPPDSASPWTGWRAGLQLGINHNVYDGFGSSNTLLETLEVGYDYQVNSSLVLGGDFYSDWNNDNSHSVNSMPGVSADFGSHAYGIEGLVGVPVQNLLPYVKVGYGNIGMSGNFTGSDNSPRYGLGVMWLLNSDSAVLVQYMYQKGNIPNSQGNGDIRNRNLTIGYDWFF